MLTLPESIPILIVGAGPTGLSCAISLVVNGVKPQDIIIIDAQPQGHNLSRAIAIHAKTLEELETMGCTEKLISRGIQNSIFRNAAGRTTLVKADFASLSSRTNYPYILTIPQTDTEHTLEERLTELGVLVRRPHRLAELKGLDDGVQATLEGGETIKAKFIVGADGSRSMVRRSCGIGYKDPGTGEDPHSDVARAKSHLEKPIALADVQFSKEVPPQFPNKIYLGPRGLLLFVRLPDQPDQRPIYRLGCKAAAGTKEITKELLEEALQVGLEVQPHETPRIDNIIIGYSFHIRYAVADTFSQSLGGGAVALVGDAAHIHSPAGGQGMNLGIRDAIQLGRVIANLVPEAKDEKSVTSEGLQALERYSSERRSHALKTIKMTKTMTWLVMLENVFARTIRNIFMWVVGRLPGSGERVALRLSGLQ